MLLIYLLADITTEQDLSCNEIEVIIKYPQKDKQVNRIIDFLQSHDLLICTKPYALNLSFS